MSERTALWQLHMEPRGFGLSRIFVFNTGGTQWVGRNRPRRNDQGQQRLTSILHPSMLLGPLEYWHWSDGGLSLFYQASTPQAKRLAFIEARRHPRSEVSFPYPPLNPQGQEFICPVDFWECDNERAAQLNIDEGHLREHCVDVLRERLAPGALIHDPACSTGELISHLARAFPHCHCLGSDRSGSMIGHAQTSHAGSGVRFRQTDAGVEPIACDVLILRFLNAEVVTRHEAETLLRSLLGTLKPGGVALVFGHTPVLPAIPWVVQKLGLVLESCVAAREARLELFQFYLISRPNP